MRSILIGVAIIILIAACASNGESGSNSNEMTKEKQATVKINGGETLKRAFQEGKALSCSYTLQDEVKNVRHHIIIQGEKVHLTIEGEGETIINKEGLYTHSVKNAMEGCDWIQFPVEQTGEQETGLHVKEEWTLEDAERTYRDLYHDISCKFVTVSPSEFTPKGKVCDIGANFGKMLTGMNN